MIATLDGRDAIPRGSGTQIHALVDALRTVDDRWDEAARRPFDLGPTGPVFPSPRAIELRLFDLQARAIDRIQSSRFDQLFTPVVDSIAPSPRVLVLAAPPSAVGSTLDLHGVVPLRPNTSNRQSIEFEPIPSTNPDNGSIALSVQPSTASIASIASRGPLRIAQTVASATREFMAEQFPSLTSADLITRLVEIDELAVDFLGLEAALERLRKLDPWTEETWSTWPVLLAGTIIAAEVIRRARRRGRARGSLLVRASTSTSDMFS
ncbi:MAG: hypothetical protein SFX72_08870 [Isosphaeraceae bacterium]|nr:hypothetical protein [Isosphaeraceae bacterium]